MRNPFIIGERVYLRFLEESDVSEEYIGWLNNKEVTRYLETGRYPSTASSVRRFLERFSGSTTNVIFGIIVTETDEHIGNVTLNNINWIHRTADTGIMIGKDGFRGKGYAFEALSLTLEYAFERLGLRRVEAGIIDANVSCIAMVKKLGFKEEGIRRKHFLVDGEYRDVVKVGIFKEEFHKYL